MSGQNNRIVVELDDEASELMRLHLAGVTFNPGGRIEDPRDLASGAIVFLLADVFSSTEALEQTRARRWKNEKEKTRECQRVAIGLDNVAARLLGRFAQKNDCDPRDVVNASVVSMLACCLDDESRPSDGYIQEAKARRLASVRKGKTRG